MQLVGLWKRFGGAEAVRDVSLEVRAGEIYGLIGPNGAGKTTTFRILAGLMVPTAGRVVVGGIDVATAPLEAKRRLGLLGAGAALYARLTAREALAYAGRLHGLAAAPLAARIAELSALLALAPILDRRCERLSTGERQRVAIARAVLHAPDVLILDEPTAGLDVLASRSLREFVRAERARGRAVLFSTHYLAEAELLCDRIGLMHRGRLLAEGTPAALRAREQAGSLEEAFLRMVEREGAA